jgi:uncharacterized protein YndB with AHSA1/START domain
MSGHDETRLVITREFAAPRELVWRVWTEPRHLEQWFGPEGFTTRVEALDLRPGGRSRYVMVGPDGAEYPSVGQIVEVVPGERLVTTDEFGEDFAHPDHPDLPEGMILTCLFEDIAGDPPRTLVTLLIDHPTVEQRRKHEEMGVVAGWQSSFGCLDAYLTTLT